MKFVMDFENSVISPPDNYIFLNFIPIVINLYTLTEIRKSIFFLNRLEVSFNAHEVICMQGFFFFLLWEWQW